MFKETTMLNAGECGRVAGTVHGLRQHWEQRHELAPFFTLGAASYLDGGTDAAGKARYHDKAARLNPVLIPAFDWLYERLLATLSDLLGGPCAFEERSGRPGFHIFLPDKVFENPVASVHYDLQYLHVFWRDHPAPDFEHPVSFTGSIVLPRAGAGLNTWDLPYREWGGRGLNVIAAKVQTMQPRYHPYTVGRLALHNGHMVHQIAAARPLDADNPADARITLQGHAIRSEGTWWVYW